MEEISLVLIVNSRLQSEKYKGNVLESAIAEPIVWHFIPARSSHFGGLWKSTVRSMKLHLKRTIGNAYRNRDDNSINSSRSYTKFQTFNTLLSDDLMDLKA